jgi:hypothetical protein
MFPPALKKVLIVSPHFPPINAPDMQRVRMSLPYYRAHGWEPVVLAVGKDWQLGVTEPNLLSTVPSDVRVVHVPALSPNWSRWIGIGNLGLRAWPSLFRAGGRLLGGERVRSRFLLEHPVHDFRAWAVFGGGGSTFPT